MWIAIHFSCWSCLLLHYKFQTQKLPFSWFIQLFFCVSISKIKRYKQLCQENIKFLYLDLKEVNIPSILTDLIINDTGIKTIDGGPIFNHSIVNIVIEDNADLKSVDSDFFYDVKNLQNITIKRNTRLQWTSSSETSLFFKFTNTISIKVLDLESNNISCRGEYRLSTVNHNSLKLFRVGF